MFNNALQTNQNVSISGGSESQTYYASFGYLNQNGIFLNSNYERFNFQFNQNISLTKNLKLKYKISYVPGITISPAVLNWDMIFQSSKLVGIKTDDGKWLSNSERVGDGRNALYAASKDGGQQVNNDNTILGNISLDYDLMKNVSLNGSYGIVRNQSRSRNYKRKLTFYDQYNPENILSTTDYNILDINNLSNSQHNASLLVNYNKQGKDHNLTALAGVTAEWYEGQNDRVVTKDFLTEDIYVVDGGTRDQALWNISGSASDWALASLVSRVTYSYKGKYLFEAGGRYDGSSRFKKKIRWGFFPSASLGWIISDEDFLKGNHIVSFLKVRASWGQVGNQNVGLYPFANLLSQTSTYFGGSVFRAVGTEVAPNPLLTWETKESTNLGIEGRLLSGLFEFNLELFTENTKDILLRLPVPTTFGQVAPVQNAGRVDNKGWELELTHRNNVGKFYYGVTLQVSDATNKVIDMKGISPVISGNQITEEGHPMNEWYGIKAVGIFQTAEEVESHSLQNPVTSPGDLKYQENGGDPNTINSEDRVRLGRSDPRYPFGIRLNFNYKNFDFIAFGQGVMFNLIYSRGTASQAFFAEASTIRTYQLDRWSTDNPDARYPKFRNGQAISVNSQFSSFWLENASYFRLKQLEIGYKISENLLRKVKLERIRIFLSAQDLFVFTKYLGYDPEKPNAASYPLPKLISAGVNINF
jgi:TonB-linked SusC/RagA family outer membrane protein